MGRVTFIYREWPSFTRNDRKEVCFAMSPNERSELL